MPSSYSELGLNKQATGENASTWGAKLNDEVIELAEEAIIGRCAYALSGTKVLTNTNAVSNEARCPIQHITSGTGGTVTIPDISRIFLVINDASGDVVISASGGTDATVHPGERLFVICTGASVYRFNLTALSSDLDMNGNSIADLADPTTAQEAATKAYVDAQAFEAAAGNLPGQGGNSGRFLGTDGADASWTRVWATVAEIFAASSEVLGITVDGAKDALAYVALDKVGSTYTPDFTAGINHEIDDATGSITLANPSAVVANRGGKIKITWVGSGSLALGTAYYRRGGDATFSGVNGQTDYMYYDPDSASLVVYDVITNPTNT